MVTNLVKTLMPDISDDVMKYLYLVAAGYSAKECLEAEKKGVRIAFGLSSVISGINAHRLFTKDDAKKKLPQSSKK